MARSALAPAHAGTVGFEINPPNPARLFGSLRDSGYTNDAAVADLVDNSVDGGATKIRITVQPDTGRLMPDVSRIVVSDDGAGMSIDVLRQAMKLGSETSHDLTSDLGKYGMGLITASISMGRRLTVLTKEADAELFCAIQDLQQIERENQFLILLRPANEAEQQLWRELGVSADHGTVVIIDRCDQLSYATAGPFVNQLKKKLGQTFRLFIVAKSTKSEVGQLNSFIEINGAPVYAVDPLMLKENEGFYYPGRLALHAGSFAELVDDFSVEVPVDLNQPNGATDSLRIRVVTLPDLGQGLSSELGINAPSEGFYVVRNQREIAPAQTLGIFAKSQNLTTFRAELHVPATLDKRMRLNWMKQRVEPDELLIDVIKKRVGLHIRTIRKKYNRRSAESTSLDHKAYEALISKKAKLLTLPKSRAVRRIKRGGKRGTVTPQGTEIVRQGDGSPTDRVRERCVFREAHMTASGPLWEPDWEGSRMVVTFNIDHPLWTRYVLEADRDDESAGVAVVELLHLFAFCISSAESNVFGDEQHFESLVNMRQELSNNMRVLLT